ncbi:hypothetical protein RvY_13132 [Ramazzottius varieornatus]|uniref:Tc1-like transposase DDE domain-containing protein n=1 Tax=Ramazzottius varieornatus TaxID=947166 RepID=A0A1D1VS76_RAMVA|nr:hypothetical protein RvY_13132 [Ramazzottius varieornatus]
MAVFKTFHNSDCSAVDMWSIGCILAELISKQVLMKGTSELNGQLRKIHAQLGSPGATFIQDRVHRDHRGLFFLLMNEPEQFAPWAENIPGMNEQGRRKAIAHLCQRSPRTIQNITTNWDLITGPPSGTAVESNTVPEDDVNETLVPVVEAEEMEGVAGVGRHLLFVRSFTGSTRDCGQSHPSGSGKRLVTFDVVTDRGFVPGCGLIWEASKHTGDYHGNFNYQNYEKFMEEVVVPRLEEFARLHGYDKVVIVLDNASYHSRLMPQFRRPKRVKKEIQQWLTDHRIEFGARELVAELWQKVTNFLKNHVGDRYYMDDYLKTEEGIETVRLPPYHCDFNPIEKCWARRKGYVAKQNTTRKLPDLIKLWDESADIFKPEDFPKLFAHCIKLEDDYWDIDTKEDRIEAVGDEHADEDVAEEGGDLEPLDQDLDDDNDLALLPF